MKTRVLFLLTLSLMAAAIAVVPSGAQGILNDGGYWLLTGNSDTSPGRHFLGTTDDQALEFRVNNARALRLEPDLISPNVVGGYSGNLAESGVFGAAIGGGGSSALPNRVTDHFGAVGGGTNNQAGSDGGGLFDASFATVGGGWGNTASGNYATVGGGRRNRAFDYATVSGGSFNQANAAGAAISGGTGNRAVATNATVAGGIYNWAGGRGAAIGGGILNVADGQGSTVGGGVANGADGEWSTVPGGRGNTARGDYSFAAGRRAVAKHNGAFVWADANDFDFVSAASNQFSVRATGGVRFVSALDASGNPAAGVILKPGAHYWSSLSDRESKENVVVVDRREVLTRLAEVPISTWNYKSQDASIRHIGPMAQDFYAAFGLGEDDLHIATVDAEGVALVSIQGLYSLSQEQAAHIQALEAESAAQRAELAALAARLSALEGQASGGAISAGWLRAELVVEGLLLGVILVRLVRWLQPLAKPFYFCTSGI